MWEREALMWELRGVRRMFSYIALQETVTRAHLCAEDRASASWVDRKSEYLSNQLCGYQELFEVPPLD